MTIETPPRPTRPNISGDVTTTLREWIVDGRLAAGSAINEVQLARSQGVSRTPLREALSALMAEGAVIQIPRRGFFVRELSLDEAQDIYLIRPILDPEALRQAGLPNSQQLEHLERLIGELRKAKDVHAAITADDDFYKALWSRCPNKALTALIELFMLKTRRYELACMGDARVIASSSKTKQKIVDSLRSGDLDAACKKVRASLEGGLIPVAEWLRKRGS